MKQKLKKIVGAIACLGLTANINALGQKDNSQEKVSPAVFINQSQPAVTQIEAVPNFTETEYNNIELPPHNEMHNNAEILSAAETALYKLHAQNKHIDALPTNNYSKLFLNNVIETAAERADETFLLRADALKTAAYDTAYLHGKTDDDNLFRVKLNLMAKIYAIMKAEQAKFGKETDDTQQILYHLSFMGDKELYEIIDLLEKTLSAAFDGEDFQYSKQTARQISNLSKFHGWLDGLKRAGIVPQISQPFYYQLETDLSSYRLNQRAERIAAER